MKRLIVLATVVATVAVPGARAAAPFAPCGPNGLQCATLDAPLDYSGMVAGEVPLYVEELPAAGPPRGVMLLVAGGPGQASAETFELGRRAAYWRSFFPGYTLVAYDDRGAGKSGPLNCNSARTIEQCGSLIPNRAFYTTREHAEDIEIVRVALGVDKLAIFGVSYGAKHAYAYALAHPDHVERLLLDSVPLPDRDIFGTDSLRAIPGSLDAICIRAGCPSIPAGIGERFATLANQLEANPVVLTLTVSPSRPEEEVRISGETLLSLAYDSDLSSGVSSQLPAAIDAALAGSYLPLARLSVMDGIVDNASFRDINTGLNLATNCGDGPFPWQPNDAVGTREAALSAALAALPAGATGAFGTWATNDSVALLCLTWPSPAGGAALGPGPLPDVPVLILSGERDIRTPTSAAVTTAARFSQGRVLVVPGACHSVLDHSDCAAVAVRGWLDGAMPPAVCSVTKLGVPPLGRWSRTVARTPAAPHVAGLRGRTLTALVQTLRDAEDAWLLGRLSKTTINGLVGGRMVPDAVKTLRLTAYSAIHGLSLTGTIVLARDRLSGQPAFPLRAASGTLAVTGVASGNVRVNGHKLAGMLGGKPVAAGF